MTDDTPNPMPDDLDDEDAVRAWINAGRARRGQEPLPPAGPAAALAELRLQRAAAAAILGYLLGSDAMLEAAHDAAEVEGPVADFVSVVADLAVWEARDRDGFRIAAEAHVAAWAARADHGTRPAVELLTTRLAAELRNICTAPNPDATRPADLLTAEASTQLALDDLTARLRATTTRLAGVSDHPDPEHTARCRRAAAMNSLGRLLGDEALRDHAATEALRESYRYRATGLPPGTVFGASAPIEAAYVDDPAGLRAALEAELRRLADIDPLPDDEDGAP